MAKLSANLMIAAAIESTAEASTLANGYGISRADFIEMITSTLFAVPVYQGYGKLMVDRQFEPAGFKLSLGLKDVRLALEAGDAEHGASVHFVVPELDAGAVIGQVRIPVMAGDTPETLAARLLLHTFADTPPAALTALTMPTLVVCGDEDRDNGDPVALAAALPLTGLVQAMSASWWRLPVTGSSSSRVVPGAVWPGAMRQRVVLDLPCSWSTFCRGRLGQSTIRGRSMVFQPLSGCRLSSVPATTAV